jgi:peroxiredoxin
MQANFSKFLFTAFIGLFFVSHSQNVKIEGKAHPSYIGKVINLYSYSDLVTFTPTKESSDTIDAKGYFELNVDIDHTQPVNLQIDNCLGILYVQPDFNYGITIDKKDSLLDRRGETEIPVAINVVTADTTELNTLIFDFNKQYNKILNPNDAQLWKHNRLFRKIDSLDFICGLRYSKIRNDYFKTYYKYSMAELNANATRGKNYLYVNYIQGKPTQPSHYEYMMFFDSYFKGYLEALASMKSGESLYKLVNDVAKYDALNAYVKSDPLLKNDTLRELVILRNLWEFFYSPQFNNAGVVNIVEQLNQSTKIPEHKRIASNILQYAYKLQQGSVAPNFAVEDKTGKLVTLKDFKGRYIYLNFFSTKSVTSLKEMPKIMDLVKKYGDKCTFISICTDDSIKSYKAYIKANPKYTWPILYNSGSKGNTAKDIYNTSGEPAYFFINNYGNLMQSPAKSPTQGIEGKLKALFKPKSRGNKIGIR